MEPKYQYCCFGNETLVTIDLKKYGNNRPAMMLLHHETGQSYAVVTVNTPWLELEPGEMLVKNHCENENMLVFLTMNNIVTDTGKVFEQGFVVYPIVKLNPKKQWRTGV
jgi:hypothetical protein